MTASARVAGAGVGAAAVLALSLPIVATFEGLRLTPYKDLVGRPTVCLGETNVEMRAYTRPECEAMLQRSLAKYADGVLACLPPDAPLQVKAAFTSFSYNAGVKAACASSAARKARAGDYWSACNGLMAWVNAGGKRVQGLVNRRAAERDLCLKGLP